MTKKNGSFVRLPSKTDIKQFDYIKAILQSLRHQKALLHKMYRFFSIAEKVAS